MSSPEATTGRWWSQLSSQGVAIAALLSALAALTGYFAFNSGGFFPGAPAFATAALCVVLLLRCLFGSPFEGVSVWSALVVVVFAAYTILTLVSQGWSHSPGLALEAFNQTQLYLLVLVVMVSVGRNGFRVKWVVRTVAVVIVGVCVCSLISRVLPRVWPIDLTFAAGRLSFPISYWNALGLFAAFGIVLCVHLSSERRERAVVRVVAAAAVPMLGVTLYFTLSRGGIGALVVGVIVYLVLGRPRLWISTAIAVAPTTAVAAKVAYGAGRLTGNHPTSARAVVQGHHVAVVLLGCILAAAFLRLVLVFTVDRLARRSFLGQRAAAAFGRMWAVAVAVVLVALVIGFHGRISHEFHQFTKSGGVGTGHDARSRLTSVANDNRLPLWRVAYKEFEKKPLLGQGAGTFQNSWDRFGRASAGSVINAHNLYAENLDTLGIVGTALLVIAIVGLLVAALVRVRRRSRTVYAAIFAVMVMWALHAAIDWDWQMPVLTILFFGLGGLVLGPRAPTPGPAPAPAPSASDRDQAAARRRFAGVGVDPFRRGLLGIGCCLLAVAPVYIWLSQRDLDAATNAFSARNCPAATRDAIASINILGTRPQAYEAIAYCDVARQQPRLGLVAIRKAVSLDPDSWRMRYGLAAVRAAGDLNPQKAARRAIRLYPQSSFVRQQAQQLLHAPPAGWSTTGERLVREISSL